jgi:hypothetical protein
MSHGMVDPRIASLRFRVSNFEFVLLRFLNDHQSISVWFYSSLTTYVHPLQGALRLNRRLVIH